MIDVKDGYGEEIDDPVTVHVTTTGGFFENGENYISGTVFRNAAFWLVYDPERVPNGDFPGQKTLTAIIDYGCENSHVTDTAEIVFLSQGERVAQVSLRSDRSTITDADNGFAIISATVVGEYGAALSGITVYFSVSGGANAAFDADTIDTNANGVAQTVLRPNGDIGLLKVCGTAGSKTGCIEITSEKAVD